MIEIMPECSQITDTLYLGAIPKDIQQYKYVFNLSGKAAYYISCNQRVMICPFNDCDLVPDEEMLYEIANHVSAAGKKGKTLVHCAAGINRSALILALSLIIDGMKPADAIALLREKRGDIILYNKTFENWLLQQ